MGVVWGPLEVGVGPEQLPELGGLFGQERHPLVEHIDGAKEPLQFLLGGGGGEGDEVINGGDARGDEDFPVHVYLEVVATVGDLRAALGLGGAELSVGADCVP